MLFFLSASVTANIILLIIITYKENQFKKELENQEEIKDKLRTRLQMNEEIINYHLDALGTNHNQGKVELRKKVLAWSIERYHRVPGWSQNVFS